MNIIKIIYSLLTVFITAFILLLVFSLFPITGNIKFFIVQSGSMQPAIKMGDLVVIKPSNEYKLGDVITFSWSKNKDPITHRIYEVESDGIYITKGDANRVPDSKLVSKESVLGKVILDVPLFGFVIDFAKKPLGFILLVIIPALAVISNETRKIIISMKNA